jgi:hypothetical protein
MRVKWTCDQGLYRDRGGLENGEMKEREEMGSTSTKRKYTHNFHYIPPP